ncbi:hypothetical protein BJX70DRAFT_359993 [Aspergillus crustosus]
MVSGSLIRHMFRAVHAAEITGYQVIVVDCGGGTMVRFGFLMVILSYLGYSTYRLLWWVE